MLVIPTLLGIMIINFFIIQAAPGGPVEKMPASISLGLWTTLLIYFISIPLGIAKAVRDGSRFDISSSTILVVLNAIPGFLFALLLVVLFAGGSYFKWFPLRGLVSEDWGSLGT